MKFLWRQNTELALMSIMTASLVARGTCAFSDCALSVLATVVSVPSGTRAVIDAGSKVLTSDLLGLDGYGHVLGRPDIVIDHSVKSTVV